ncbi:hypothetical protein CDL12_00144 [Handroanthus impetiginosus]|uniref:Putative plant transposon protein domain-containing protein n=1 Tax=Handroanthus impetiginosus TaxID=429701 RepID=A0A2G9IBF2_9LAMI|nr:hypothetical protein CDL12_00144 [Handroanthus impetiginosus]
MHKLKNVKRRRKPTPTTGKRKKPTANSSETAAVPISTVHPLMSINWKPQSSDSSSSGEPSSSPPAGMGSHTVSPTATSFPKPSPKTLFADNVSNQESSESKSDDGNNEDNTGVDQCQNPHGQHVERNSGSPPLSPNHDSGNTPPISPSSISDWKISIVPDSLKFLDESAKEKYFSNFCFRKLNRGRGVLFSSIPESPVLTWLQALNWDRIMSVNEICYPHLVKLFYSNLIVVENDSENVSLKSFVLGKEISLTTAYINSLFDLPDEGSRYFSFGEWNTPEFSLTDLRNFFWEGKAYSFSGGKALNNLSIDHFFLHKLICCTLLSGATSGGGHTTDINTMSIYLTFMAVHGRSVNLGFVLLKYMAYSATHPTKNLPYGMLLSLIFKKANVFLPPTWMEPLKARRIIDLNSLHKMRIQYSETNGWYRGVRKEDKEDPIQVSSSPDSPPRKRTRSSSYATSPPQSDSAALLTSLTSLHTKIDSQSTAILEIKAQLKKLSKRLCRTPLS